MRNKFIRKNLLLFVTVIMTCLFLTGCYDDTGGGYNHHYNNDHGYEYDYDDYYDYGYDDYYNYNY